MTKVPFKNIISYTQPTCTNLPEAVVSVPVSAQIKTWHQKWSHLEIPNPGKGDDITFILVFGNDGELTCPAMLGNPTVEDILDIQSPIDLKLMSLCLSNEFELWVVEENDVILTPAYKIDVCHIFQSGRYKLQLRKVIPGGSTPYFDIPCHFVCCLAMLFQLEFPACPPCPDDCKGRQISNGSFEDGLTDWNAFVPEGGVANAVTEFNGNTSPVIKTYNPIEGDYFALLKTDGPGSYTSISQTISICAGDTIEGWAFFYTTEQAGPQPPVYKDNANVRILDNNDNVVSTPFTATYTALPPTYGITDWTKWSYTFLKEGTYTLIYEVSNAVDSAFDSYIGADAIRITK